MDYLVVRGASQHNLKNVSCELPAEPPGRHHRAERLGQVVARVRHHLRRGPAPLRRVAVGLRAAVPRAAAEARRREHRGSEPGDRHRAAGARQEPALDRRHGHRDRRLPAPAVRARRRPALPELRQGARGADGPADRRRDPRAAAKARALALLAPIVRARKGELRLELERLRRDGFVRARIDGESVDLGDEIELDRNKAHDLDVVVDRIVVRDGVKGRLTDSVELALKLGDGHAAGRRDSTAASPMVMSERLRQLGVRHHAAAARAAAVLVQRPARRVPGVRRPRRALGRRLRRASSPTTKRSLREGAVRAFGRRGSVATADRGRRAPSSARRRPRRRLARAAGGAARQAILYGSRRAARAAGAARGQLRRASCRGSSACSTSGERRSEACEDDDADEGAIGDDDSAASSSRRPARPAAAAPAARGARGASSASKNIAELGAHAAAHAAQSSSASCSARASALAGARAAIAVPLLKRGHRAARLPDRRRARLPDARPRRAHALRRRGPAHPPGDADRRLAGRRALRARRAERRPARARQRAPARGAAPAGRQRQQRASSSSTIATRSSPPTTCVDMGPGAGVHGGTHRRRRARRSEIMRDPNSVTGPYLSGEKRLPDPDRAQQADEQDAARRRRARAQPEGRDASRSRSACSPRVTGRQRLGQEQPDRRHAAPRRARRALRRDRRVGPCDASRASSTSTRSISIDQAPIGRTPRSNPATYTGIFTHLRELYAGLPEARARGYKPGRFSFNVKGGRCEACQGDGVLRVEMHFLPDVFVTCDACSGQRYNRETLEVRYRGLSIADALELTVDAGDRAVRDDPAHPRAARRAAPGRPRLHHSSASPRPRSRAARRSA